MVFAKSSDKRSQIVNQFCYILLSLCKICRHAPTPWRPHLACSGAEHQLCQGGLQPAFDAADGGGDLYCSQTPKAGHDVQRVEGSNWMRLEDGLDVFGRCLDINQCIKKAK